MRQRFLCRVDGDAFAGDPPVYTYSGGNVVEPREVADRMQAKYISSTDKERCVKNMLQNLQGTFRTIYTSKLKDNTASVDAGQGTLTPDEARAHALASGKLPSELVTALIQLHEVQKRTKHHQSTFSTEVGGVLAMGVESGVRPGSNLSLRRCLYRDASWCMWCCIVTQTFNTLFECV
jgi:hypothetical protein